MRPFEERLAGSGCVWATILPMSEAGPGGSNEGGPEHRRNSNGRGPRVYTPAEYQSAMMHKVEETLGAGAITAVEIKGLLGEFKDNGYRSALYGVKLLDLNPDEADSPIELVIPRRQFEQEAKRLEHRPVRVRGDVETNLYRGRIGLRLCVRELRDLGDELLEAGDSHKNRERAVLSVLGGYRRFGREMPQRATFSGPFKVCVIHPASGVVARDFAGRLKNVGSNLLNPEYVAVSFQDPGAIGEAVSQPNADVVALIRGGGDSSEFRPLTTPSYLRSG